MTIFSKPAQRAFQNAGITSLNELKNFTEKEIKMLHGLGPATLRPLKKLMEENGITFRAAK